MIGESRSIARISTTVTFDDGTLITWTADDPLRPSFEVDGPFPRLAPLSGEELYLIREPEPWRFAVKFESNFRVSGLACTTIPPGSAITVHRDDLRQVYEYARHFDVGGDSAMTRIRSALGLPGTRMAP